jgi:putative ABC transport system permease protein
MFEPAYRDLRIEYLSRRSSARSIADRWLAALWFAGAATLLWLDVWRLVLQSLPRSAGGALGRARRSIPREPFIVFIQDLRYAFRRLIREPGFTVAAGLTLTLGVGGSVAVFAVVEAVLLRPLPFFEAERLVVVNHRDVRTGITKPFIAIGDFVDLARRQSTFSAFGGYGNTRATVFEGPEPYQVSALLADAGALEALAVRPVLGRSLAADDSRPGAGPVVLLGHDLWTRRFGTDSSVVGRSIKLDATRPTVVGILPPDFRFPPTGSTDLVIAQTEPVAAPAARKSGWTFALARLAPNRTLADADADLGRVARALEQEYPESNQASSYFPVPLRDSLVGSTKTALVLLLAAVALVLLIACANVANLFLARSLGRRREMALRMTLGAGRGRLASQLLVESLLLATLAGGAGIGLAAAGARALSRSIPGAADLPGLEHVGIDGPVLLVGLLLTIGTALVFGTVSVFTLEVEGSRADLVAAGRASLAPRARRATSGLVVAEIALAVMLLIGAGLVLRSFAGLLAVDPGFQIDRIQTLGLELPAARYQDSVARELFYQQAFAAIRRVPGVEEIGAAAVTTHTGNNWTVPFERADQPVRPGERPPEVGWQVASGGYFSALRIPLRAGRLFDRSEGPASPPTVIISESIRARYFAGENPVGRMLKLGPQTVEIVGVVGDIRRAGLDDQPRADLYFPFERLPSPAITLFIRTAVDPATALPGIRRALRELEPDLVLGGSPTMAELARDSVRVTRLLLWLLGFFAATALLLAAIGIYGVMAYTVRQRTREIGTRMALGAARSEIVWLVVRQGATLAGLGTAIGIGVGLAAARALGSVLYGVGPTDPAVLAAAAAVLAGTAALASFVPARRAAAVDPARTLADQ